MNNKKLSSIIALLCAFAVLFSLTACKNKEVTAEEASSDTVTEKAVTEPVSEATDETADEEQTTELQTEVTTEPETEERTLFKGVKYFDFDKHDADPSKWSTEEIVACYSAGMAAADSSDAYTDMVFQLIGDLPGAASILKKPVNLAMRLGAKPYNALTGGYWDLTADDLVKADAHRDGKYVVINLYPKVQVDGPNGNEHEGSVGHVVNVVEGIGDFISYVEENYGILHAYYDDDSVVLTYKDPYAKNIRIDTETGKMVKGTWGYDVHIYLDHCGILGVKFNDFNTAIRWKCWYPVED